MITSRQRMYFGTFIILSLMFYSTGCTLQQGNGVKQPAAVRTLAFGSCLRQWQKQPVWQGISNLDPDAFIFVGDNVYTDIGPYRQLPEPERIGLAYRELDGNDDFQAFRQASIRADTAIFATWDDHDYGKNDAGAEYPFRIEAKKYFLEFFGLSATASGGSAQPGIYQNHWLELDGIKIQLLLLDTRSFRSALKQAETSAECPRIHLTANTDPAAMLLGEKQWQWLESMLMQPADIRLLVSSIQLIPAEHCYEKWANFPAERNRLFNLLKKTGAQGVIVISGDRHLAEVSRLPEQVIGYPLHEITASGLNSAMGHYSIGRKEKNQWRMFPDNVRVDNFGSIQILKEEKLVMLLLQIRDKNGRVLQEHRVSLDVLKPVKADPVSVLMND